MLSLSSSGLLLCKAQAGGKFNFSQSDNKRPLQYNIVFKDSFLLLPESLEKRKL
jgi:hypothetical protein